MGSEMCIRDRLGSLAITFALRVGEVTRPAVDEAKHRYREELALAGEFG